MVAKNNDSTSEEASKLVNDLNIDFNKADENELLAAFLKADSENNDKFSALGTTSEISTNKRIKPVSRIATNLRAAVTQSETGKNVNDLVEMTSASIDKDYVQPNDGQGFNLTSNFKTNGRVNAGDYFTVDMPEYANYEGIADYKASNNKIYPTLTDGDQVVANGVYDVDTKKLVYTFTDYVNNKDNVKGSFSIPQYIDRKNAKTSGTYDLNYNIAGENVTLPIDVKYTNYNTGHVIANADSLITKADLFNVGSYDYTQYIYVNPNSVDSYDTILNILGYQENVGDSSTLLDPNNSNIRIFDAGNSNNINPSFYVDENQYEEVTDEFNIDQVGEKHAQINFGHIDHPYIVKVTSKIDPNSTQDLRTRITMTNKNFEGTSDFYGHDNYVERSGSNGQATGNERLYSLGDYVWEDTNKNGLQDEDEKGIQGVKVSIIRDNGIKEETYTDENGKYRFDNLRNGSYVINFETPKGYTPTNANVNNNNDDAKDSDGLSTIGIIKDEDNWTLDSGFYKTPKYKLGDYVWYDYNEDGNQDEDEKGIQGVTVTLKDSHGNTLKTTQTDENGKYIFEDLESGEYNVHFEKPDGLTQTSVNSSDDSKDADGENVKVTITDHDDMTIDNGYFKKGESESASLSESESKSLSDSESKSLSESESKSLSDSESKSLSESESKSLSDSESKSLSESESKSLSDSESKSLSESESKSLSDSESKSTSESTSNSTSESTSESTSNSTSESTSESTSNSTSESTSESTSNSTSESTSESHKHSDSLPDTGDKDNNGTLLGTLLAGLGSTLLLGRRRKKEDK
ncbi:LPXTG cell wall anchor domain-containing protein [Staphylococcus pragensis]|uniref:LPXTG cell wall anchor domain-containing protein n=1 Tax=Staphylococcus pragensis TaxID=1611836 RepID=A0A4Z1BKJ1_9STAP|nr:SdrD B-like domain-containing protein [Staphylococcus pragensis]TGN24452.1 LPXTG cell wall anchor domain-containing protein [Staphylococcus pragensis]